MTAERRDLAFDHGAILLGALLIGFIVPGYMMAQSPFDVAHLSSYWLRSTALLISAAAAGVGLAVYWPLRLLKWRRLASGFAWLMTIWPSIAGLLVPIIGKAPLTDLLSVPISPGGLTIAILLTLLLLWLSQTRFRHIVAVYLVVTLIGAVAPLAPRFVDAFFGKVQSRADTFATLSSQRNILVISFDGVSRRVVEAVFREDLALARSLADFTLYRNAIAPSPATDASMRAELFGDLDFKAVGETEAELRQHLDYGTLPLNRSGIDAFTYANYNRLNTDPARRVELGQLARAVDPLTRAADTVSFYRYVAVRLATPYSIRLFNALGARGVDGTKFLRNAIGDDCRDCGPLARQLLNHKGADWDRPLVSTLADLDGFTDRLRPGSSPFSLRYMHFLFSHFPVDFDANCNYRSDDAAWVNAHQNEAGLRGETRCVLVRVARLLERLKVIGVYDRSLIVLKSDHGAPASYFATTPDSYPINGHPLWGYDRYRPLLMIKRIGETGPALRRDDRLTLLSDLATTVCRQIPGAADCKRYPGIEIGTPAAKGTSYRVYVVRDAAATQSYDTHVMRSLPRDRPLLDSLIATGDIVAQPSPPPAR